MYDCAARHCLINDPLKYLLSERHTHTMCMKGKLINAHMNFTHTTGYSPSLFYSAAVLHDFWNMQKMFDNIIRRILIEIK